MYFFLQEFPILSKLDPKVYGPPESAITKELLEEELNGMSIEEVLDIRVNYLMDAYLPCFIF